MRLQIEVPVHLIDITRLGLARTEPTADGGLLIGAMVRHADLANQPRVRADYAVLSQALPSGASGQLRNRARNSPTVPLCRGGGRCRHRWGSTAAHAGRIRCWPYSEHEDGHQPGHWRDDLERGCSTA